MSAFWGARFRSYFANYCLPSLLAPGNLGSLSVADGHKLLICTTPADWEVLKGLPAMAAVARHAKPQLIEIDLPGDKPDPVTAKFRHMSYTHRLLTETAYRDGALTSLIMPDAMYTDGTLATAIHYAEQGAHAVLAFGPRLIEESLLNDLRGMGAFPRADSEGGDGKPISLNNRDVVAPTLRNFYSDCLACDWDAPDFHKWPPFAFWRTSDRRGLITHCFYPWYVLLDFAAIERHNTRALDEAAIENSWLTDNFPDPSRVRVMQDSDEGMVISWTPAPAEAVPVRRRLILRVPMLGDIWKGFRLRATREFDMAIGDFQKANMIRYPIRWHSGGFDADWAETEARSRRIMLWFFGDVFKEFAEGLPRWKALLFRVWWLFLRSGAKLRARLQSFTYSARHRFRSLRLRTLIATALRPGPTK